MRLPIILSTLSSLPLLLAIPYNYAGLPSTSSPDLDLRLRTYNSGPPYCPGRAASEPTQRAIFNAFLEALYTEKNVSKAFLTYVTEDLVEHDPTDQQGRAPNIAKLEQIVPFAPFTVLRSSFDNNVGFVHLRVEDTPEPLAVADIYRMNGTCIVEHWDVTQARPANTTNPIAMF